MQNYLYTIFSRDYVTYVRTSGRNEHAKFGDLIAKTLSDKLTEIKIQEAIKDADKKRSGGLFGIFGQLG